jgi:hypothetical protein
MDGLPPRYVVIFAGRGETRTQQIELLQQTFACQTLRKQGATAVAEVLIFARADEAKIYNAVLLASDDNRGRRDKQKGCRRNL